MGSKRLMGVVLAFVSCARMIGAEESPKDDWRWYAELPNLESPTLGGKQVWNDKLVFHDWRIQANALTGHHRLLDGHDVRHAWGSFDHCRAILNQIKERDRLAPMQGSVVIVLHGLGRTRGAMANMEAYLDAQGFSAIRLGYASTIGNVAEHARSLASALEHLDDDVETIHMVGHSLGNLVARRFFHDQLQDRGQIDTRIGRMVMLAPPNQGSRMAELMARGGMTRSLIGVPGRELAEKWDDLKKTLAIPPCQFGVIAGGKADGKGYNSILPGDDDFIVTVDETRLAGARDFLLVRSAHTFIMDQREVQEATARFLKHGHFVADDKRRPIE